MPYILTLNNINKSDLHKIGYRALDIALVFQARYKTPLSFVVPNVVFDEFMIQTRLGLEISKILSSVTYENEENLAFAYSKIKSLFSDAIMPEEFVEHLREAYNSLAVKGNASVAQDLLSEVEPTVCMIVSPDYVTSTEDLKGVIMNISGFDAFLDGIKSSWLSMYSPESLSLRNRKGIKEFNVGIVVQRMVKADYSCEAYSKGPLGDYEVTVRSYLGLPDIVGKSSKDIFSVSKEYLKIESSRKARQEYQVVCSDMPNKLIKRDLGNRGVGQKLSDKEIVEVARLTKRMQLEFGFHFKAYFLWKKENLFFFMISRFPNQETSDSEELLNKKIDTNTANDSQEQTIYEEYQEPSEGTIFAEEPESEPEFEFDETQPKTPNDVQISDSDEQAQNFVESDNLYEINNYGQQNQQNDDVVENDAEPVKNNFYEEENSQEEYSADIESDNSSEEPEEEIIIVSDSENDIDSESEDEYVNFQEQEVDELSPKNQIEDDYIKENPNNEETYEESDETSESNGLSEEFILSEETKNASQQNFEGSQQDVEYYKEILQEVLSKLKAEVHRRYSESFGIHPESLKKGIDDLHDKHGIEQKEDLLTLIIINEKLNGGIVPDLNTVSNIISSANKFLGEED